MDHLKFYLFYLESHFTGYAPIIRITAVVVSVLILIYLLSMFRIFLIAYKLRKTEMKKAKFFQRFENPMQQILASEENLSTDEILSVLRFNPNDKLSKWEKKQMTDLITGLKENSEENLNSFNYNSALNAFNLIEFWENKLRKQDLSKNRTALRKLDAIASRIPGSVVAHRIYSKNKELRKHAKCKYIQFSSFDGFKFLEDNFDNDFNLLDGIRIHNALKFRSEEKPLPPLIRWVHTATNEKFQCFLIKEIGLFGQSESAEQLVKLFLESKSFKVKAQIAETLGLLNYKDAIPVLAREYDYNPLPVQMNIVDAMGVFATEESLGFLETAYRTTHNNDLLIKIVHNIYKTDKQKATLSKLKDNAASDFEKKIFEYQEMSLAI